MNIPEKLKKTLNSLSENYNQKYPFPNDYEVFEKLIKEYYNIAQDSDEASLINKLSTIYTPYIGTFIKVNTYQIPNGVLPKDKTGYIRDINVNVSKKTQKEILKKEPNLKHYELDNDDYVYKNHPDIRKNIPRGLTTFRISNKTDTDIGDSSLQGIGIYNGFGIYANKKFIGLNNQDDDNDNTNYTREYNNNDDTNDYFIQNKNTANKIIFMEKINGEAFHFSGRYFHNDNDDDIFYWFLGSKRNHIMIGKESDIDLYTDERYRLARVFAKSFMKLLNSIAKDKREILQNLLHYTKITAICEILQPSYQHIVHIKGKENTIVFLAFCSSFNKDSLTAFPPHVTCKVMETLNMIIPNYQVIKAGGKEETEKINEIRSRENSEGMVLYYLNEQNQTIGLLKVKTFWYILLRALREKLNFHFKLKEKEGFAANNNKLIEKINKRYDEIQKWLGLTNDRINGWKEIAEKFVSWLNIEENKDGPIRAVDIKSQFPIYWNKFKN